MVFFVHNVSQNWILGIINAGVEAAMTLAQFSQKTTRIGKFTLNQCLESSRFPIDIDKAILKTNNLSGIELIVEFERK